MVAERLETPDWDGQWVTAPIRFWGLPEKQKLPDSSDLFLNRSKTPRRGGGRSRGSETSMHVATSAPWLLQIKRKDQQKLTQVEV